VVPEAATAPAEPATKWVLEASENNSYPTLFGSVSFTHGLKASDRAPPPQRGQGFAELALDPHVQVEVHTEPARFQVFRDVLDLEPFTDAPSQLGVTWVHFDDVGTRQLAGTVQRQQIDPAAVQPADVLHPRSGGQPKPPTVAGGAPGPG
jgi:hypothetical protein